MTILTNWKNIDFVGEDDDDLDRKYSDFFESADAVYYDDFFGGTKSKTKSNTLADSGLSSDDNTTAADAAADHNTDKATYNFAALQMKIGGNKNARAEAKDFIIQAAQAVVDHGFFEDPDGVFANDLVPLVPTNTCGIYGKYSDEELLQKIGSTGNFVKRFPYYKNLQPDQLRILFNLDMADEALDSDLNKFYNSMINKLIASKKLHRFQQDMLKSIRDRGGGCLGLKEEIVLQMIESGFQLQKGLPSPQEFLVFDDTVHDRWYDLARANSDNLLVHLSDILDWGKANGYKIYLWAVASWATAYMPLSSKVETDKCLVGKNWMNALPFPAIPNAKTVDEAFSTAYTDKAKAVGCGRVIGKLEELLEQECGIILQDSNNLIFSNDPFFRNKSIFQVLEHLGFKYVDSCLHSELVLYMKNKLHAVFVNKPWCIASDSQAFITSEQRTLHGAAISTAAFITQKIRGLDALSKNDTFENPINAALGFQLLQKGFHKNLWICAAAFHDRVLCESTNALVQNRLAKLGSDVVAISLRVQKDRKEENCARPVDAAVMNWVQCMITAVSSDSKAQIKKMRKSVDERLSKGVDASTKSTRWSSLIKNQCRQDSKLQKVLQSYHNGMAQNKGYHGSHESATNAKIHVNNDFMQMLTKQHKPPSPGWKGSPFWVPEKKPKSVPADGTMSVCGTVEFPGQYPVYHDLVFSGLVEWCRPDDTARRQKKGNTAHTVSVKYPKLNILWVKSPTGCNNAGVKVVEKQDKLTYILVNFEQEQEQDEE